MEHSGTCDYAGKDDEDTILKCRGLVKYLPQNCREKPPNWNTTDSAKRETSELEELVPGESQEAVGLIRHIGKITEAYATSTVPKISVVLREAYADAGSLIMGGQKGLGADFTYAWVRADLKKTFCRSSR